MRHGGDLGSHGELSSSSQNPVLSRKLIRFTCFILILAGRIWLVVDMGIFVYNHAIEGLARETLLSSCLC